MSKNELKRLLDIKSKHSQYQEIPSNLNSFISEKKDLKHKDKLRFDYLQRVIDFKDKSVLDIGANAGFFTFSAVDAGAHQVKAYEPNRNHADYILKASELTNTSYKIKVINDYFEFTEIPNNIFDIVLCLNVLHHVGDDYGDKSISLDSAKNLISNQIKKLASFGNYCFLQIGFNWKGDKNQPLFKKGTKKEIIEFVSHSCINYWRIKEIAIFDPVGGNYKTLEKKLLFRFDQIGEFLNRPIFFLEK